MGRLCTASSSNVMVGESRVTRELDVSATSQVPSRLCVGAFVRCVLRAGSRLTAKICGSLSHANVGVEAVGVWNMVTFRMCDVAVERSCSEVRVVR